MPGPTPTNHQQDQALTAAEAADLTYLDPQHFQLLPHGASHRLVLEDRCYLQVSVVRTFPLTEPDRFLSIRAGDNKEIGIIVDPRDLEPDTRQLVAEELKRRYLVPVVQRVVTMKERFGTVDWEMETDRGIRKFTTRNLRENVVQPSPGRYLIPDVDGNRYDIIDLDALDQASQDFLRRHV